MKKLFCIILSIILLVSLCGCFGNKADDVRGTISNGGGDELDPEFSLGKTSGGTYSNDFLGLSCTLPTGWEFYTDKQILELNNIAGEYMDEDVAERLKNAAIVYDMAANHPADGSNININMEKLSPSQLATLNIQKTLESQFDTIKSTFKNMGFTDINLKYQKVTVDGTEFDGVVLSAKTQGVAFYETIFTFRKSNYLANITVCSVGTDNTAALLDCFSVK